MSQTAATRMLRDGLLESVQMMMLAARGSPDGLMGEIAAGCRSLGARLSTCEFPGVDGESIEDAVTTCASDEISVAVIDGIGVFSRALAGGADPADALRECLEEAWDATRR